MVGDDEEALDEASIWFVQGLLHLKLGCSIDSDDKVDEMEEHLEGARNSFKEAFRALGFGRKKTIHIKRKFYS